MTVDERVPRRSVAAFGAITVVAVTVAAVLVLPRASPAGSAGGSSSSRVARPTESARKV